MIGVSEHIFRCIPVYLTEETHPLRLLRCQRMAGIHLLSDFPQSPIPIVIQRVKIIIMRLVIIFDSIVRVHILIVSVICSVISRIVIARIIVSVVILLVVAPIVRLCGSCVVVRGSGVIAVISTVLISSVIVVMPLLALLANIIVVVPRRVSFAEGFGDLVGGASLAAVEGRAERHLFTQEVSVNIVAVAEALRVIITVPGFRALLIHVHIELKLRRGVRITVLASYFSVEGIVAFGRFFEHNALPDAR